MGHLRSPHPRHARLALAGVSAGVLAWVLAWVLALVPALGGASAIAVAELAALSLVVLALTGQRAARPPVLASMLASASSPPPQQDEPAVLTLRTRRATPQHHPLAPRAPGLA